MRLFSMTEMVRNGVEVRVDEEVRLPVGDAAVPLTDEALQALQWADSVGGYALMEAELAQDGALTARARNRPMQPSDREAVVLVSFAPGVGGFSEVTLTSFDLVHQNNRVYRRYHPLSPSGQCVKLLSVGVRRQEDGVVWNEYLVRVRPSDGPLIRCYRTGDTGGAPPEVEWGWDGRNWHKQEVRRPRACLR